MHSNQELICSVVRASLEWLVQEGLNLGYSVRKELSLDREEVTTQFSHHKHIRKKGAKTVLDEAESKSVRPGRLLSSLPVTVHCDKHGLGAVLSGLLGVFVL